MSNLEQFDFNGAPVRVVTDERGEPWFVLADVCQILGIANGGNVAARLDCEERGSIHLADRTPAGGNPNVTIVSEPGLWMVVLRSDSPAAKPFQRWVTGEVLPAIRRHGVYASPATVERMLADPDSMIAVLTALKDERVRTAQLTIEAAVLTPKAEAFDVFLSTSGDYSVNEAAKVLSRDSTLVIGECRLREFMTAVHWLYRDSGGQCRAFQTQVDCGRLSEKARWHYHPKTGDKVLDAPQIRVAAKGLARLAELLKAAGVPDSVSGEVLVSDTTLVGV
jgi:prophage antirepressor-like protein